jgi:CDP-diacylglycerol--serine O-phosphatidyltransferase
MDGRLARYLGVSSRFGAELDSLSDFISFGASPTIILYLHNLQQWNGFGWFIGLCLSMCMALRLARFNTLSIEGSKEKWDESFFMGVPSPMAALIALLPIVLQLRFDYTWLTHPIITTVFVLLAAAGAVSRVPTFSTKKIYISRQYVLPLVLSVALFIAALFADPWLVLSIIGIGYICTIPFSVKQFNK